MNAPAPTPAARLAMQLAEQAKSCRNQIHRLSFTASSNVEAARQLKDLRRQSQAINELQRQMSAGLPLDPSLAAIAGVDHTLAS